MPHNPIKIGCTNEPSCHYNGLKRSDCIVRAMRQWIRQLSVAYKGREDHYDARRGHSYVVSYEDMNKNDCFSVTIPIIMRDACFGPVLLNICYSVNDPDFNFCGENGQ